MTDNVIAWVIRLVTAGAVAVNLSMFISTQNPFNLFLAVYVSVVYYNNEKSYQEFRETIRKIK